MDAFLPTFDVCAYVTTRTLLTGHPHSSSEYDTWIQKMNPHYTREQMDNKNFIFYNADLLILTKHPAAG